MPPPYERYLIVSTFTFPQILDPCCSIQRKFIGVHISPLHHSLFHFSGSQPIWFSHGSISGKEKKTNQKKKKKNKQKRRKCPEMAFRPSHWDCSIRICYSHQSHCGIRFFKRKMWSYCWWSEVNLLNSRGNWLLILIQVVQIIETEFPISNLQKTFTTEFENIREIILITALIRLRPSEDCWVIVSTSSWRSFNNIHFTIGK